MKAKVIYILIMILGNFLTMKVFGDTPFAQILPPSSDAGALGKYGQYPVNLCNGLVQIDVPIHTIKLPLFNLPVSISYHASGIKVDEISTPVGLGWVLNAGGVITRAVNGLPDQNFGASGLIHDTQWMLDNYPAYSDSKIEYLYTVWSNERNGAADTETDVFYYNFCGFSGSFWYDINGNLIQIPLTNNRIEFDGSNNFKITGSDGTIYYFSAKETSVYNVNSGWVPYTSSWYLSWIKTTDNREIDFEYMEDNTSYGENYPNFWLKMDQIPPDWSGLMCETPYYPANNTLLIKSISLPIGSGIFESINFDYTGDRSDRRKYRLTNIRIKNNATGENVKSFSLDHSYFISTGGGSNGGSYSSHYNYRLKLDKVVLLDSYNNSVGNYGFDYNASVSLPAYFNNVMYNDPYQISNVYPYFGQDEWGYYNGVTTNKNLFIYRQEQNYTMPQPQADRSVNPAYAQACILKKITYPTGGYTEFEYEGNKSALGENAGGLRIKSVKSYSQETSVPVVRSYQYENGRGNITGWRRVQGASYTQGETVIKYYASGSVDELKFFDYYFSLPNLPLSHSGGSPVFYERVTEFEGYPDNSIGKTDFSFLYSSNDVEYVLIDQPPLPYMPNYNMPQRIFIPRYDYLYIDRGWTRGYPTRVDAYEKKNGEFSLVKRTVYEYSTFKKQKNVVGFKAFANFNTTNKIVGGVVTSTTADGLFQYTDIIAETGLVKLTGVKETIFSNGNSVEQITANFYNNLDNQYEISASYQTNSDGSTLKKSFKYPKDINLNTYMTMADRNMLSQVIITTDSINNKFLQESETVYSSWLSPFSSPLIAPSGMTVKRGTSAKETEFTYHNYDRYGNLQYVSRYDADPVVYLWGYNYQYPIAEIKNTTFAEAEAAVQTVFSVASVDALSALATPNETKLKDGSLQKALPNALVTTYTYKPLVGVLTMTDPRGMMTRYEYDSFGRLNMVTEADKAIEMYEYHYKN